MVDREKAAVLLARKYCRKPLVSLKSKISSKHRGDKKVDQNQGAEDLKQVAKESDELLKELDEIGKPNEKIIYNSSISIEMGKRLASIQQLIQQGYTIDKAQNAFPVLTSQLGRNYNLSIFRNPAGFSWIGFFFPYAVCTQIREWSYFYITSIVYILASITSFVIKYDISNLAGISLSISYGIYFPYLRYIAVQKEVKEIPRGKSIIYGLLLSVLAVMPSLILDLILGVS